MSRPNYDARRRYGRLKDNGRTAMSHSTTRPWTDRELAVVTWLETYEGSSDFVLSMKVRTLAWLKSGGKQLTPRQFQALDKIRSEELPKVGAR